MKLPASIIWLYIVLCVFALLSIVASTYGWFGIERNSFSSGFALFMALPWSLFLRFLHHHGAAFITAILAFAMAFNLFLLLSLQRRLEP